MPRLTLTDAAEYVKEWPSNIIVDAVFGAGQTLSLQLGSQSAVTGSTGLSEIYKGLHKRGGEG